VSCLIQKEGLSRKPPLGCTGEGGLKTAGSSFSLSTKGFKYGFPGGALALLLPVDSVKRGDKSPLGRTVVANRGVQNNWARASRNSSDEPQRSSLCRQRPPIREGRRRAKHEPVQQKTPVTADQKAQNTQKNQGIGTAGVVQTSLSGVKSYD